MDTEQINIVEMLKEQDNHDRWLSPRLGEFIADTVLKIDSGGFEGVGGPDWDFSEHRKSSIILRHLSEEQIKEEWLMWILSK